MTLAPLARAERDLSMCGARPDSPSADAIVLNPRGRLPVSLIIDDSTCLVNLAHFAMPAFAEAFPSRYPQDWRSFPREIPDSFVEEFGGWCHANDVKGKYSIVPYPACVGWVDRELPGWTRRELERSLELVRARMTPDWDIHPEMVSHTWVIDTKTGRPYPERTPDFMENWEWTTGRSVDEIADYLAYALQLLKNVGLPCEGITTPGGFGQSALPQLAQATLESCRAVFSAEIPHYFRHVITEPGICVAPRVEYASGLDTDDPRCVVSLIGCTDDWFGGWDGITTPRPERLLARLPEVLDRGEPAILVCHWPGIWCNGERTGFRVFQETVGFLKARYGDTIRWMKLSEITRYWAAAELTGIRRNPDGSLLLHAPFACPEFTLRWKAATERPPTVDGRPLAIVADAARLVAGACLRETDGWVLCFDLPRGETRIEPG